MGLWSRIGGRSTRRIRVLNENGAGDRARTGDLDLGKVALYQLSYSRSGLILGNGSGGVNARFPAPAGKSHGTRARSRDGAQSLLASFWRIFPTIARRFVLSLAAARKPSIDLRNSAPAIYA